MRQWLKTLHNAPLRWTHPESYPREPVRRISNPSTSLPLRAPISSRLAVRKTLHDPWGLPSESGMKPNPWLWPTSSSQVGPTSCLSHCFSLGQQLRCHKHQETISPCTVWFCSHHSPPAESALLVPLCLPIKAGPLADVFTCLKLRGVSDTQ